MAVLLAVEAMAPAVDGDAALLPLAMSPAPADGGDRIFAWVVSGRAGVCPGAALLWEAVLPKLLLRSGSFSTGCCCSVFKSVEAESRPPPGCANAMFS